MIITTLINKIEKKIIISKQFGLVLRNPNKKETDEIIENILSSESDDKVDQILAKIHSSVFFKDFIKKNTDSNSILNKIVKNLVCIDIDEKKINNANLSNRDIINPTCELSYELKFIKFTEIFDAHIYNDSIKSSSIINYYSDNYSDHREVSHLLSTLSWKIKTKNEITNRFKFDNYHEEFQYKSSFLIKIGMMIDDFIEDESDFMLLDYLFNSFLYSYDNANINIVHLFSLIELLIANPHESLHRAVKNKIREFYCGEDFDSWIDIVYKIRNKIAHGEFTSLSKLCNSYCENHMYSAHLDYYEFRKEVWVLNHIQGELEVVVSKIIMKYLTDKKYAKSLKTS